MLTSILIGLDGSAYSDVALELGLQWAQKFNAMLVGLGIVDEPTICKREPMPVGGGAFKRQRDERLLADGRRKVEEFLERFGKRCAEAGIAHQRVETKGLPYREILRESRRCDLVFLGHETHFHFVTDDRADETLCRVVRHGSRPVVVAPATLQAGNSVVVAYNGSPPADRALQAFQASGLDLGEEVAVISVDQDDENAKREAGRAVEFLGRHGIQAVPCVRPLAGTAALTILDEVRQRNARLLVMGAYGHSAIREALLGSVTKRVLRDSSVPVFLCS